MILDALDRGAFRSRADRLGFRDAGNLEKLAADFDAHAAISGAIECHLRGGLCMPFHVASEAHRISVDIDPQIPNVGTWEPPRAAASLAAQAAAGR